MKTLELLFIVALLFYTTAIWSHKLQHKLDAWMVWLFGLGLTADILGTVFLCIMSAVSWGYTLHTISGFLSVIIMALHFIWAVLAINKVSSANIYFDRFSIYAWILWLISFVSGIPLA